MSICIHLSLHGSGHIAHSISICLYKNIYIYKYICIYRHRYTNLLGPQQNEVTNKTIVVYIYIYVYIYIHMITCIRVWLD